jgi:branched-chain amino acid aminotransferase
VICFNGEVIDAEKLEFGLGNRLIRYGDGVFETMKWVSGEVLFFEDHYFRLMSSMRILRMEIPMNFSPEFLEKAIRDFVQTAIPGAKGARLRLTVFRKDGGLYAPYSNDINWMLTAQPLDDFLFPEAQKGLILDLYKDFSKTPELLSTLKTCNSLLYVLAGNYARENTFDDVMLLNTRQEVTDTVSSNIFLLKGNTLITPPINAGPLKGIMRKQVMSLASKLQLEIEENTFSPFELQRADEVWLTNVIQGVRWVKQYRKKTFTGSKANDMQELINKLFTP